MSFRSFIRNLSAIARADISTFQASNVTSAQAFQAGSISAGMQVPGSSRPAENVIMAYACIAARREAIGGQQPKLTNADMEEIENTPASELLASPNAAMDWDQFVRVIETHLTLHNCAAVHITRDNLAPELCPLQPEGLQAIMGIHQPSGTARIVAWNYIDPTTAVSREFPAEDVVVRMGYNPHAPLSSLSPTRVLDRTIKGDIAAREQNLGMFQNDATPRGYLHTDQGMTKEQALQVLDVWNSAQQGFLNRHKTAALWGGVKYDRVQLSPAELEFLESLRQSRIDFYMAFRVYPAMLAEMTGETGLSQGSSTNDQRVAWWEDVGLPELKLIAGLFTECLERLNLADGNTVWFNEASIPALARQRLGKVDQFGKLVGAGYRPDDVNDFLDLGLPEHPDNAGRVAFSLQTIGEDAVPPKGPAVPAPVAEAQAQKRAEIDSIFARIETALVTRAESPADGARAKRIEALEKTAAKRWSRFFIEQRGRVLRRLETLARNEQLARAASEADSLAFSVFPRAEEDKALVARINPVVVETMRSGWEEFGRATGIQNPFQIEDPNIQKAIAARKIQCLKVNSTTEEDLRGIFSRGFDEGATVNELADRVATYYAERCEGVDSDRALNAAETQTTGIVNDSQLLAAKDAGGLLKYWVHAPPGFGDDRPDHLAAAREYSEANAIALDATFRVGGEDMQSPGDPEASPANVCRCRCWLGFTKETR